MLRWIWQRTSHTEARANRKERRALECLARLPQAELQVVTHQLRKLTPDKLNEVLARLPAWQQDYLRSMMGKRPKLRARHYR